MIFTAIPAGEAVFVDANTFVYRYSLHPRYGPPCVELLARIERQEITGFTSTHVVCEAGHRIMTLEAITTFNWPQAGIGNRLRTNPTEVAKLSAFRHAVEAVFSSKIQVLPVPPALVLAGPALSQQYGLLTNDALVVAVMQANGLNNLASLDDDFDRVPSITRYAPA